MKRLLLVSSVGGHLSDLLAMTSNLQGFERVWVLQGPSLLLPGGERFYLVAHAERDWRVVWNLLEFAAIIARERPDAVLSAGAGIAVPAAVVARLARIPFVYVEPSCCVTRLSLTGRLVRRLTSRFYVQWPQLRKMAPKARYEGGVY